MTALTLMGKKQHHQLPPELQDLQKAFPLMSLSREFFNTLEEIESIRQTIFDISNGIKRKQQFLGSLPDSLQSLKQWVTFTPPKPKSTISRLFSSSRPSEKTVLLMYAAAAVMGAWMSFTSKDGSETCSQFIFKQMLDAQALGKSSYYWENSLKKQAKPDEFWKANPDIFAVVDRLLTSS